MCTLLHPIRSEKLCGFGGNQPKFVLNEHMQLGKRMPLTWDHCPSSLHWSHKGQQAELIDFTGSRQEHGFKASALVLRPQTEEQKCYGRAWAQAVMSNAGIRSSYTSREHHFPLARTGSHGPWSQRTLENKDKARCPCAQKTRRISDNQLSPLTPKMTF